MKLKTRAGNLDLARRIRGAGIPIYIPEDDPERFSAPSAGLLIYQTGGCTESFALDWAGGTQFVIWLTITTELPGFAISSFDLELPWRDRIRWLEEPLEISGTPGVYQFGGTDSLELDRADVLNHHADAQRILPLGTSLRGCLLGVGSQSMPDHFRHGQSIPAFITVHDQHIREYRSTVSLWADRSAKLRGAARPTAKRKRLFDCPDSKAKYNLDINYNKTV